MEESEGGDAVFLISRRENCHDDQDAGNSTDQYKGRGDHGKKEEKSTGI